MTTTHSGEILNSSTCVRSCSCWTIQLLQRNVDTCTSPIQQPHDGMRHETPVLGALTNCSQQFVIFKNDDPIAQHAIPSPSVVMFAVKLSQSIGLSRNTG